jgi:hypothetical protein
LTVISRSGKLLILRACEPPDPDEFDALIAEGIKSSTLSAMNVSNLHVGKLTTQQNLLPTLARLKFQPTPGRQKQTKK